MATRVYPTPSEAIKHDACAICLGGGETFDIVLDRLGKCSGCGGSGDLDDMLARQCGDPRCTEHGRLTPTALAPSEEPDDPPELPGGT